MSACLSVAFQFIRRHALLPLTRPLSALFTVGARICLCLRLASLVLRTPLREVAVSLVHGPTLLVRSVTLSTAGLTPIAVPSVAAERV